MVSENTEKFNQPERPLNDRDLASSGAPASQDTLSEEDEAIITERLRQLGYIE